jgi:hypothetical protein
MGYKATKSGKILSKTRRRSVRSGRSSKRSSSFEANFLFARHPPTRTGGRAIHLDIAKEANYSALNVCAGSVAAADLAGMTPASKDANANTKMAISITATFTLLIS